MARRTSGSLWRLISVQRAVSSTSDIMGIRISIRGTAMPFIRR
jgi:hypothetical protein